MKQRLERKFFAFAEADLLRFNFVNLCFLQGQCRAQLICVSWNEYDFEKHIPDIYQTELQLSKANTSDKETSFHDLI